MKLLALFLICISIAIAQVPGEHQPRTLGNTAVMHVYYYAPKTLEITYVESYLFKDEDACKEAITKAIAIASMYASEGDLIDVQCVGMHPPDRERSKLPRGSTEL